ncbi:hypothetical protein [Microbacterium sp. MPKO10]|uniref:hypothetical protein n=1 Tax=Microbacterium sp. MPKO10 TaxID=2989818 RepID=UPI002235F2E0|nr:hypothetical protein [Microbacterium sp. MPKO10]MCW4457487.1 hypothetical protein [Microbacterium sp. MPKO10]
MRIGVASDDRGATGVAVFRNGDWVSARVESAASFADHIDSLLRKLRGSGSTEDDTATSITIDVSGTLTPQFTSPVTLVRISPRHPLDAGQEMSHAIEPEFAVDTIHCVGGHTILGEPLLPLDVAGLEKFACAAPRDSRYVVSSVGSLVNPAHELQAGHVLLECADPESIEYAHRFSHGSIAVRERTALINSSLLDEASAMSTTLGVVADRIFPRARLFVTTNDGGSAPIASLADSPVHSLYAGLPTELIGAAAISGVDSGGLVVSGQRSFFFGEITEGVPSVIPLHRDASGLRVATQTASLLPVTDTLLSRQRTAPTIVAHGGAEPPDLGISAHHRSDIDIRALGAARVPRTGWANRVVNVSNATEMNQALTAARARVEARLVASGSSPSEIRILESRVIATAYQHPRVVSVRVRGVAGESAETALREARSHGTHG